MMRATRAVLLAAGVLAVVYGGYRLLALGWANTRSAAAWLLGGLVLHDGVLAPLTIVAAMLAVRVVRPDRLAPWVVGLVILVPATLLAVPELGRFGARTDNPTLLDRNYWLGWWALVVVVVVAILVATYARGRPGRARSANEGGEHGQAPRGR